MGILQLNIRILYNLYMTSSSQSIIITYQDQAIATGNVVQEEDSSTSGIVSDFLQSSVYTNDDSINDSGLGSTSELSVGSNH